MLRRALDLLPSTLYETYARILCNIDESYCQLAIKALQWLVYSKQPLELAELVDVLAIDVEDDRRFDADRRLPEPKDVLKICSSLITITTSQNLKGEEWVVVKLAHFSVQEYLISQNILRGPAAAYTIDYQQAHTTIAEDCLTYLMDVMVEQGHKQHDYADEIITLGSVSVAFPLARYAAYYWDCHARTAGEEQERLYSLIHEIFYIQAFHIWVRWYSADWSPTYFAAAQRYINRASIAPSPIEIQSWRLARACQSGLPKFVGYLLQTGSKPDALGVNGYTALQAAVLYRHLSVTRLLLNCGANVNAPSSTGRGPALNIAAALGYEEIVQVLLQHGADMNAVDYGTVSGTALISAVWKGHVAVAKLLVTNDADVNRVVQEEGYYGHPTALIAAVLRGNISMVKLLLTNDAQVNIGINKEQAQPLQIAACNGYTEIVAALIAKGADVNAVSGSHYETALRAAVKHGHNTIVQMLLAAGAEVYLGMGSICDALEIIDGCLNYGLSVSSSRGYDHIIQLLLDRGMNVNAERDAKDADVDWNALRAAARKG
ncbi:MAG: hypothetical protein Q9166_008231 [cf. Caloplaca sp. 2 TL-2023]